MLLADLRTQLRLADSLTVAQLARQQGVSESAVLTALQGWLQRGRVRIDKAPVPSCASRCGSCSTASSCAGTDRVVWQGD